MIPSHDIGLNQWGNASKTFAFPTALAVPPGEYAESSVILTFDGTKTISLQRPSYQYRIDGGAWVSGDTETTIGSGAQIDIRFKTPDEHCASGSTYALINGAYIGEFDWQTFNDERAPKTWYVTNNEEWQRVAHLLVAGDVVEMQKDVYQAIELRRPGMEGKPIVINGNGSVIMGNISDSRPWTLSLWNAHHYDINNLEIKGGTSVGLRNAAHGTFLNQCKVYDCAGHGILGDDQRGGSLCIYESEVYECGRADSPNSAMYHAVYVGADHHRYPHSKLGVYDSKVHNYRGVGIKSRVRHTFVQDTEITQSTTAEPPANRSYYAIELIGPDGREPDGPMPAVVQGCTINLNPIDNQLYGIRMGGDGTGYSMGDVIIKDNTFNLPDGFDSRYSTMFPLQYRLQKVALYNNKFTPGTTFSLFSNGVKEWYDDEVKVIGTGNQIPETVVLERTGNFPQSVVDNFNSDVPAPAPTPVPTPTPSPDPEPVPEPEVEIRIYVNDKHVGNIPLEEIGEIPTAAT